MPDYYDVIIVGSGPAGIFAALELSAHANGLKVLVVEKGKDLEERQCPADVKGVACVPCKLCSTLCGWGGAGAFSDGKLTLTPDVGGFLGRLPEALYLPTWHARRQSGALGPATGGARASSVAGKRTLNVEPRPGSLETSRAPL